MRQREIKFRAWDKKQKRFLSQDEINGIGGFYYNYGLDPDESCFELMQFTGLYDNTKFEELTAEEQNEWLKNHAQKDWKGKPVYEGDVVKQDNYIGYVEYDINTASFKGVSEDGYFFLFKDKIEIIGNVFEHQHLLEQST